MSSASSLLPGWQQKECWLLADLRGNEDLPEHSQNTLNILFKQVGKELPPCLPLKTGHGIMERFGLSSSSSIPPSSTIPGCSKLSPGLEHFQLLPTGVPQPSFTSLLPPSLHLNNSRGNYSFSHFNYSKEKLGEFPLDPKTNPLKRADITVRSSDSKNFRKSNFLVSSTLRF